MALDLWFLTKIYLNGGCTLSEKLTRCVQVFNSVGGCISWRECRAGEEYACIKRLQEIFKAPQFVFKIADAPPDVPPGGYTRDEAVARRVRFVKNVT